jgi:hypothetical protein
MRLYVLIALTECCANLLRACIKLGLKIKSGGTNVIQLLLYRPVCASAECFIVFVV